MVNGLRILEYGFKTSRSDRQREEELGLVVFAALDSVTRAEVELPEDLARVNRTLRPLLFNSISSLVPAAFRVVNSDLHLDKHVICPPRSVWTRQ